MSEAERHAGGMKLGLALTAGAAALAALAYLAFGRGEPASAVAFLGKDVTPAALELGSGIYAQNCAACHGRSLEGQPDWKRRLANGRMPAPPHDASGHSWHHSDQDLFKITKEGIAAVVPGYASDMPVFGASLSDDEITAVLAYLKSTWPERERAFQAEVTKNAELEGAP